MNTSYILFGRGAGTRTPSHGFGDRWFTINRLPYIINIGVELPAKTHHFTQASTLWFI